MILKMLSWLFGLFFLVLFVLCLWSGNWLPAIPVILGAILLIPPLREKLNELLRFSFPFWSRLILVPILFILFFYLIFSNMGNKHSIYKSPKSEQKLMSIYDAKMEQWPVPYESRFIQTQYGKVHVIISGPEDAPPILLLHASAMAGWSWLYNVKALNKKYRTYAIDTIGDAGRSVLKNVNVYPNDGPTVSALYEEIMDSLGVAQADFVGASQGGFISTNMALYAPERMKKLVLSGPMGYTGTSLSIFRILLTTMFPIPPFQDSAFRWAFGKDPVVKEAVNEWFYTILESVVSRQPRPSPFANEQLQQINLPVLMLLGSRDGLVGDPASVKELVSAIPNVRVEILDTGHLISAEKPDRFNALLIDFIDQDVMELSK